MLGQNKNGELELDTIENLCDIDSIPIKAEKTGVIILGSGLIKNNIFNSNLMINGTEYCVVVNMAPEEDRSGIGAGISEAVNLGDIAPDGDFVKVVSEVSLVLPSMIEGSFKKYEEEFKNMKISK